MQNTNCYHVKPFLQRLRTLYSTEQGLPSDKITCAVFDTDKTLWIGTDKGLAYLDNGSFKSLRLKKPFCRISMLFRTKDNIICAGAENAILLIKGKKIIDTIQTDETPVDMTYDGVGNLWVLASHGLYLMNDNTISFYRRISEGGGNNLAAFGDKKVFISDLTKIHALHGKRPRLAPILPQTSDMPSERVQTMVADKWGHIWMGTDKGVCIYDTRNRWLSWNNREALPEGDIRKIIIGNDGTRYIGTADGLIIQGNSKSSFLSSKRWIPDDTVTALAVSDDSSLICVGTDNGISLIENKMMTLKEKADHYQSITEKYHVRDNGFVTSKKLTVPGDITSGTVEISDNDGLWTGHYACSQIFRYGVTKEKEALDIARRSVKALLGLAKITGIPGFTARAIRREGDEGFGDGNIEWHLASDDKGTLEWKGETSSDEMVGHFYTYALYFDICADEKEKKEVADVCQGIVDHILTHNYHLCDCDGLPTTWANWNPQELNFNDRLYWERGVNSMELLSMLLTVYHMTGEQKYRDEYENLVINHDYALNCMQHKIDDCHTCHIDDNLGFLSVMSLLRYEEDPELRQYYLLGLNHHWQTQRVERFPLWNFIYGALTGEHCDICNAVKSLQELPLDLTYWKITNSTRKDLNWDDRQAQLGERPQLKEPLSYDEKPIHRFDGNPFLPDGGNDMRAEDGAIFLHPYWFSRYFGLIDED